MRKQSEWSLVALITIIMQYIGQIGEYALMYLTPQTIPESLSTDQMRRLFAASTAGIKAPWVLLINCAGANPAQLIAAKRVNTIIRADYSDIIYRTWLINAGTLLRGVINMFLSSPEEAGAIMFLEADRLGLFVQLQRAGCSHAMIDWFIQQLPSSGSARAS